MSSSQITLRYFFSPETEESTQKGLSAIESTQAISSLKEVISREAKEIKWATAYGEILEKIQDALDISITDIMAKAWGQYKALLEYADTEKHPPGETSLVPLAEHTIKSEHHPGVEVLISDNLVGKIEFDVEMELELKGIVLRIQDGKIKGINTGTCKGKGSVKYKDTLILEKETAELSLPGSIDLGDGIPIK